MAELKTIGIGREFSAFVPVENFLLVANFLAAAIFFLALGYTAFFMRTGAASGVPLALALYLWLPLLVLLRVSHHFLLRKIVESRT